MIIITYLLVALYIRRLELNFVKAVTENFENFCATLPPITFTQSVFLPESPNLYSQPLATALSQVAYAVSAANCQGVEVPNPPGFSNQMRVLAPEPTTGDQVLFAMIFWEGDSAVIAFTGTEFVSEWRSDFEFQQVAPTGINNYQAGSLVHKGFYDIYLAVRDTLMSWWKANQVTNLFVTGHSLGGALSTICALDFAGTALNLIHYSFAAPRSGNSMYAQTFNSLVHNTVRVNNTEDIIPQLPPATYQGWNYEQTGGNAPFTVSLSNLTDNHVVAYKDYLPVCPQVAGCAEF